MQTKQDIQTVINTMLEVRPETAVLAEATESAAIAAAEWVGKGDKIAADQAAVDAFQASIEQNETFMTEVVIGEGVKDEAPMLAHGDFLGRGVANAFDLAVDPIDGTTFVSQGREGAISIAALTRPGTMLPWADINYMKKLVVGEGAGHLIDNGDISLAMDPQVVMQRVSRALGKSDTELTIALLDRPRNQAIIDAAHRIGARLMLLDGGDILPALRVQSEHGGIDMLYSSGGAPEAVLAAAGVAALGGNMQAMWDPQNEGEVRMAEQLEQHNRVLGLEDMIGTGEAHFALTAITRYGDWLRGCELDEAGVWVPGTTVTLSRD